MLDIAPINKLVRRALQTDEDNEQPIECYREYMSCFGKIFNEVNSSTFSFPEDFKNHFKVLKLLKQCLERAEGRLNDCSKSSCNPSDSATDNPLLMCKSDSPRNYANQIIRDPPSVTVSDFSPSSLAKICQPQNPMDRAKRLNEQLIQRFQKQATTRKQSPTDVASARLYLQRKISDNIDQARREEVSLMEIRTNKLNKIDELSEWVYTQRHYCKTFQDYSLRDLFKSTVSYEMHLPQLASCFLSSTDQGSIAKDQAFCHKLHFLLSLKDHPLPIYLTTNKNGLRNMWECELRVQESSKISEGECEGIMRESGQTLLKMLESVTVVCAAYFEFNPISFASTVPDHPDTLSCTSPNKISTTLVFQELEGFVYDNDFVNHLLQQLKRIFQHRLKVLEEFNDLPYTEQLAQSGVNSASLIGGDRAAYVKAGSELSRIVYVRKPSEKLAVLTQILLHLNQSVVSQRLHDGRDMPCLGADDLLPIICYLLVHTGQLCDLFVQCIFVEYFGLNMDASTGLDAYALSTFLIALQYWLHKKLEV